MDNNDKGYYSSDSGYDYGYASSEGSYTDGGDDAQQDYSQQNGSYNYDSYSGDYSYNNGSYQRNPQGQPPIGRNGRPLPNHFGMKLTFSIIEIVLGLFLTMAGASCFGLVPLILSVIACVMVCLQNSDYKAGNWEGFKSKKTVSSALLWVTFAFYIVCFALILIVVLLAFGIGMGVLGNILSDAGMESLSDLQDAYESGYFDDYDADIEDLIDDIIVESDAADGSGYATIDGEDLYIDEFYEFTLNGNQVSLPMSVEDFCAAGFTLDEEDAQAVLEANYDYGYSYYDLDGNYMGTLFIYNVNDEDILVSEGIAAGITINNYDGVTLELVNGVTFDTDSDEAVAIYGSPTDAYGEDENAFLYWYMNGNYGSSMELDYYDGDMEEVWIMNYLPLTE